MKSYEIYYMSSVQYLPFYYAQGRCTMKSYEVYYISSVQLIAVYTLKKNHIFFRFSIVFCTAILI